MESYTTRDDSMFLEDSVMGISTFGSHTVVRTSDSERGLRLALPNLIP